MSRVVGPVPDRAVGMQPIVCACLRLGVHVCMCACLSKCVCERVHVRVQPYVCAGVVAQTNTRTQWTECMHARTHAGVDVHFSCTRCLGACLHDYTADWMCNYTRTKATSDRGDQEACVHTCTPEWRCTATRTRWCKMHACMTAESRCFETHASRSENCVHACIHTHVLEAGMRSACMHAHRNAWNA